MMLWRSSAGDLGAVVLAGVGGEAADGLVDMIPPGKTLWVFYNSTMGDISMMLGKLSRGFLGR
jgi:hypothetical protein